MRTACGFLVFALTLTACSSEVGTSTIGEAWTRTSNPGPAVVLDGNGGTVDGLGPLGACVTGTVVAEARPSTVQMVVDTSGSMQWPPGWNPEMPGDPPRSATKWEITKGALTDAVAALPADTALGVSFFPNISHSGSSCIKNEVALPIGALGSSASSQREHFRRALAGVEPRGGTPTHCAFRFGTEKLSASAATGGRFVLLITDGTPTYTLDCAGDGRTAVDSSPLVADAAARRAQGVLTFVIGSPGSEDARAALSALAHAGGTAPSGCSADGPDYCHFDMTRARDLGAALRGALASISKRISTCEYPIPAPPPGQLLERGRVNVVYTPESGAAEIIARDAGGTCKDGWQYAEDGTHIVLCGQSCERVKSESAGEVELFFGCETQQSPPR